MNKVTQISLGRDVEQSQCDAMSDVKAVCVSRSQCAMSSYVSNERKW